MKFNSNKALRKAESDIIGAQLESLSVVLENRNLRIIDLCEISSFLADTLNYATDLAKIRHDEQVNKDDYNSRTNYGMF